MIENISIILQIHEHQSRKQAQLNAYKRMKVLNILPLASLRYDECSQKEIFLIQLIRADIQKDVKIVIEQPFTFLEHEPDLNFITDTLDKLLISYEDVFIVDLKHQQAHYKETACHIKK